MASAPPRPEYDAMYKIVLVGDAGVGKTNMLGEQNTALSLRVVYVEVRLLL